MEFKKDIDRIKKKINSRRQNIPSDITDRALTLALYYIEAEIRKRGGGLEKDFTDKFYELGRQVYRKKLVDIKDKSITDEDIKRIRKEISHSYCLNYIEDKRDFDL